MGYLKLKFLLISLILLIILLAFIPVAYGMDYWVLAYDESAVYGTNPPIGEARGNTGWGYVMNNPVHIENGTHVNALYVWRDIWYDNNPDEVVEIGWVREWGWANTWAFWAYQTDNGPYRGGVNGRFRTLNNGANYAFKVAVDLNISNTTWSWIINNVEYERFMLPFGRGTPVGGSEKEMVNDTNYAHWWSLKLKRSQGDYRNWLDLRELRNWGDRDKNYRLYKISNTEFFVVAN